MYKIDMTDPIATAANRTHAIVARLLRRGWSHARINALALSARNRCFERGQPGAHVWGLVFNATSR